VACSFILRALQSLQWSPASCVLWSWMMADRLQISLMDTCRLHGLQFAVGRNCFGKVRSAFDCMTCNGPWPARKRFSRYISKPGCRTV